MNFGAKVLGVGYEYQSENRSGEWSQFWEYGGDDKKSEFHFGPYRYDFMEKAWHRGTGSFSHDFFGRGKLNLLAIEVSFDGQKYDQYASDNRCEEYEW